MALIFGGIVWAVWGPQYGQEYLGGYITEKALSIDNLFVFVIMLSTFRVPRKYQQEVLLAGIVIALVLRLIFILAGAALIEKLLLGVLPLRRLAACGPPSAQAREGVERPRGGRGLHARRRSSRWVVPKVVPMTDGFVGSGKLVHRHAGRTYDHAHAAVRHRDRYRRRHVCRRFDPRDLLADLRGLPGVRRQRVLTAGAASALLPHRRPARPHRVTCTTASPRSSGSLASSSSTTRCTPTSCPSSTVATRSRRSLSRPSLSRSDSSWSRS